MPRPDWEQNDPKKGSFIRNKPTSFGSEPGATFTPHVDENGNLSWSNDQNLPNPEPVNITGPQGPKGDKGADGTMTFEDLTDEQKASLKGDKGDTGETGPQGPQGEKGEKGDKGADGTMTFEDLTDEQRESLRGPKGEKGDTGPQGPQGPQGETGPQGPQGKNGDKGDTGATGPQGPQGPVGKTAYEYAKDGGYSGTETAFKTKLATEYATPDFVDQQVKKAVSPLNLLDNSDWRKEALIVNQKGDTSYSGTGHGIDRWYGDSSAQTISVESTCIKVTATGTSRIGIKQKIESMAKYAGKTLTLALDVDSNKMVTVGFTDSASGLIGNTKSNSSGRRIIICTFTLPVVVSPDSAIPSLLLENPSAGDYMCLYWAALYEGSYTYSTLPEYLPKGYGLELAECQRYFVRIKNTSASSKVYLNSAFATAKTIAVTCIPLPTAMRALPSITSEGIETSEGPSANATAVSGVQGIPTTSPYATRNLSLSGTFTIGTFYSVWLAGGGHIDFAAYL